MKNKVALAVALLSVLAFGLIYLLVSNATNDGRSLQKTANLASDPATTQVAGSDGSAERNYVLSKNSIPLKSGDRYSILPAESVTTNAGSNTAKSTNRSEQSQLSEPYLQIVRKLFASNDPEDWVRAKNRIVKCQTFGDLSDIDFKAYFTDAVSSSDQTQNAMRLYQNYRSRCAGIATEAMEEIPLAMKRAKESRSALALAPTLKDIQIKEKISGESLKNLDVVLRNSDLAIEWLYAYSNSQGFRELLADSRALSKYDSTQRDAVIWLMMCSYGAECDDGGALRFEACVKGGLCGGDSLLGSLRAQYPQADVETLLRLADALAADIASRGIGSLGFKR